MSNNLFKGVFLFTGLSIALGILVYGFISLRSYFTKASGTGEPTGVKTINTDSSSTEITWDTAKETQGMIRYSSDPNAFNSDKTDSLLYTPEKQSGVTHQVKISSLKPNTTYYYDISIDKDIYDQNDLVKDNNHLPYSFTTAKGDDSVDASIPSLDATTFKQKFGSSDQLYDLNKDGIVNSSDYLIYLSRKGQEQ